MTLPSPDRVPSAWEYYLCRLDGEPASIAFDDWYGHVVDEEDLPPYLLWVTVKMQEPGPHGMGTEGERMRFEGIQLRIDEIAIDAGLYPVGRVRSGGVWQLSFYGHEEDLGAFAAAIGSSGSTGSRPDPTWRWYREVLVPDPERRQWIADRRAVGDLVHRGDDPEKPRRIGHWVYFPTERARDAFVERMSGTGFEVTPAPGDGTVLQYGLRLERTEPVELEHIHQVVMDLANAAGGAGGRHAGWDAPLVSGPMAP